MDRRTKIVATIGPASDDPQTIRALIEAGVDVCRLGFAHGEPEDQLARARAIRAAASALGRPVALLADLPGPKVRTGPFPEAGVFLAEGDRLELVAGDGECSAGRVFVDYETLLDDLVAGDEVAMGDGAVRLLVEELGASSATAVVRHGGRVLGRPGFHVPSERLRVEVPTERDLELLALVADNGFDFVAISFVRGPQDLARARRALDAPGPLLVAKIETKAAVENLDAIIDAADAVMVARGDLGVECAIEEVPHLQKRIVRQCVAFGRPVITATQMLESMIQSPAPTRAEATDIANAVFDGADALMLSGETAIGHDPVLVVRTMARIAARAEQAADYRQWGSHLGRLQRQAAMPRQLLLTGAITHAAWQAAVEAGAKAIICCTRSGTTVRAMARFRPEARLLGLTPEPTTARQLSLTWGAVGLEMPGRISHDEMVAEAIRTAIHAGGVDPGDVVVVLTGAPFGAGIDALRLVVVPDL